MLGKFPEREREDSRKGKQEHGIWERERKIGER